ncbi:SGNH/GDSL hydrolase family protein [Streptomyces sp. AJS327]|uniref:SGNH/GDSL hydrolase family protein n=1 Tax=Streptomyces sp. AJS327 TaxID=2545265 RepID=UPI0015E01817|nr:SGNH/GDSL hydrolase family protein [Streptomyces sp. AJS327]MBA0053036.1 SGNH/GDSL hydrolase family protein [Streptomyces sp. AJS327]
MLTEDPTGDAPDPYCLTGEEADALLAGHPWRRIAVLGDSVAEGLGDPVPGYPDVPWATQVAQALRRQRPELAYRNFGRRNIRAAHVRASQLDRALAFGPDLALVACGGYDALWPSFEPERTAEELRGIITPLRTDGCEVLTVGMMDLPLPPESPGRGFSTRLRLLSRVTEVIAGELDTLHLDLSHHPAAELPDLLSADGRHANLRGHTIAAAETVRRLGRRVRAAPEGPANSVAAAGSSEAADSGAAPRPSGRAAGEAARSGATR